MATIHFIQQGKGGVGKSMIAAILYQVLRHLGKEVVAFDTDPVNATFKGFQEFEVVRLDILKNGDIDPREFDGLINRIAELPGETHVIVDNGASSFLALNSYIKENDVLGDGRRAQRLFPLCHYGRAGGCGYRAGAAFSGSRLSRRTHCGLA